MAQLGREFPEMMAHDYYVINEGLWERIETGELTREFVRVERFRQLLDKYHIPGDPAGINDRYLANFQKLTIPTRNAQYVCETLCKTKTLAIITNGTASVQHARFRLSPMTPCFSEVFTSEEVGIPKPQKGFFDFVLEKLQIKDRSRVLIVGDSLTSDIKGGNNSGITACWYNPEGKENPGIAQPDLEIRDLIELLSME